jgi:hypothetical protein
MMYLFKRYKNRENSIYNKLDNLIDDMHFKTINSLVKDYRLYFSSYVRKQRNSKKK